MKKTFFYILITLFLGTAACSPKSGVAVKSTSKSATTATAFDSAQHRPQFHFTPPAKWMNDPNGMVYFKGEYHLFYQHFPDSTVWGPMHWGHAVSKNLIHWEHLPIALYPDKKGYIFSGSAVVDADNTSGFGKKGGESPIIAIFTYHDMAKEKANAIDVETQGMAYSLDKGRTWTKYADNPIIKNPGIRDFRDPKVMWYAPTKEWIVTLAAANHVEFYGSKNFKNWEKRGEFGKTEGSHGGVWECPDLFPMTVEGTKTEKWVLIQSIGNGAPNGGSGTQYFVGTFDGKTFKNDNAPEVVNWLDYGRDNYAGVTWSGAPNNRRLFLGWMSNWQYATSVPTKTWRSAMTLPRELTLKNTPKGVHLLQKTVKEAEILRGASISDFGGRISDFKTLDSKSVTKEIELSFDLSKTTAQDFGIVLSNTKNEKVLVGYDVAKNQFYIDRTEGGKGGFNKDFSARQYAPRLSQNPIVKMRLWVDVASVELLADDGEVAMTAIYFPNEDLKTTQLFSKNGETSLVKGQIWGLK